MGEPNNALNVYMNRPDRLRSVLEYYLGEELPEDWRLEEEEGFYSVRNSKGKISFRQRDRIKKVIAADFSFLLGLENQHSINLYCLTLSLVVKPDCITLTGSIA